jgi:hypothetical protein
MIIFLDFDGVISTNRAWIAQKHIDHHDMRWIDPIACAMLRDLCVKYDFKLVVTSTWRKFGYDRVSAVLGLHGLLNFLHDDWRTLDLWDRESKASRPEEIDDWLERNSWDGRPDYLILDDDGFEWTDHQRDRWVHTHQLDGFGTNDYENIINRMEEKCT